MFIEGVVLSEANFIHVFVCLDARFSIYAVHDAEVVVAGGDTVPGLAGVFEVTDVFVTDHEVIADPGGTAVITSAASRGAMDETVGAGLMVGTVDDEVVPEQSG